LCFKWIKQYPRAKAFFGAEENAAQPDVERMLLDCIDQFDLFE